MNFNSNVIRCACVNRANKLITIVNYYLESGLCCIVY